MNKTLNIKQIAILGLLLAYAMILSYIESLFPFFGGVPGMKLGLPNMVIVVLIYSYGWEKGIVINILRILLTGLLFGSLFGILFSTSGAVISFLAMLAVKKTDIFDIRGVSICGGIAHNIAQLFVAAFIVKTSGIIFYLPLLLISGALTGFLNGMIAGMMLKYVKHMQLL